MSILSTVQRNGERFYSGVQALLISATAMVAIAYFAPPEESAFKQLNDGFGHQFGDEALAHLVACARHCFPDCAIGRLGGDEFAILMYGNDLNRCRTRAQKLLAMLQDGRACGSG
mgnify:CR=1 FL=1